MATLIKIVRGRNRIEFDKGSFDNWCVYLTPFAGAKYAPKDTEYFAILKAFGERYGHEKIYLDFVRFYTVTTKDIDHKVTSLITVLADGYKTDAEEIDIWFTVLYAGMVAEENKASAILKKRIKRLGMHQILIDKLDAEFAAHYSRGKKWRDLDIEMKAKGF